MVYLIDPTGIVEAKGRCLPFCGPVYKPLYGIPPIYCRSY
jgi:hypothetical protein